MIMKIFFQVAVLMPVSVHGDLLYNWLKFGPVIHNLNGSVEGTADKSVKSSHSWSCKESLEHLFNIANFNYKIGFLYIGV